MLTVREVAGKLNVSQGCVYQLIAVGRLPHVRFGVGRGVIRVPEDDLAAFVQASRREADDVAHVEPERPRVQLKHVTVPRRSA